MFHLIKAFKFLCQVSEFSIKIGFQLEFNFASRVLFHLSFLIFVSNKLI